MRYLDDTLAALKPVLDGSRAAPPLSRLSLLDYLSHFVAADAAVIIQHELGLEVLENPHTLYLLEHDVLVLDNQLGIVRPASRAV